LLQVAPSPTAPIKEVDRRSIHDALISTSKLPATKLRHPLNCGISSFVTNMSNKIDQSLDDILKGRKTATRQANRGRRAGPAGKRTAVPKAPVGGIKKTVKPIKPAVKASQSGASGSAGGIHKVIVSRLVSSFARSPFRRTRPDKI
jgi:hypothetical protein